MRRHSIQSKLMWVQVLMIAVLLLVNLLLYRQINRVVQRIDEVFSSNVAVNALSDTLGSIQSSIYEYLGTKSSAALEDYYRFEQAYREMAQHLNDRNVDSEGKMLEKNIRNMSESYLALTGQTVQAKRGRNVERYKALYKEATQLYRYINRYIYRLNNLRFHTNSENYQILLHAMGVMETVSLMGIVTVCFLCILVATVVIRGMIGPLTGLSLAAMEVAGGNFDVDFPKETDDEVGIVTRAFRQMVASIRDFIEKQRVSMENEAMLKERQLSMEAHLKDAQLKYLQAQINPHFLFNCLNAGAQLAAMEDAGRTELFVSKMADFFRYNVKKMQEDANLSEEIEAVDNYIYILNVRFAGDIHYEKDIAPGVENIRVPSMILQPVVENAVTHGIRDYMDRAQISLRVAWESGEQDSLSGSALRVCIRDNGAGMTEQQIRQILLGEVKEGKPLRDSTGIGLDNVIGRLKLYYGRGDLFHIYSKGPGQGTEVTILLPVHYVRKEF